MPVTLSYQLSGQTKVSDAEAREHNASLYAKRTVDIPNDLQIRQDKASRVDFQPVYVGYADRGIGTDADDAWLIYKYTYDSEGFMTLKQTCIGTWDNRASETYA